MQIFEPVVQEEARHILFFVNWVKYRRAQLPWWKRPAFRLRCGWLILKQVASRVQTAKAFGGGDADAAANFTMTSHQDLGSNLTLHDLLGRCLAENERRMAHYDARLLRPGILFSCWEGEAPAESAHSASRGSAGASPSRSSSLGQINTGE